ncbi:MAG: helix-turn-helix transcriptional regulator [Erysipelotrichia bacterium]|nr:helix-turn-helix transcriptional regulator [Erysipelotrichia bacterium]
MDIVKVFGDNLRKYRTAMGISQEAFADKCGMHRTYISAIECCQSGKNRIGHQRFYDAFIKTYKFNFVDAKRSRHQSRSRTTRTQEY